jgi:hypothetical protein
MLLSWEMLHDHSFFPVARKKLMTSFICSYNGSAVGRIETQCHLALKRKIIMIQLTKHIPGMQLLLIANNGDITLVQLLSEVFCNPHEPCSR